MSEKEMSKRMISRIRNWINERRKRIAQEKRIQIQKLDELYFLMMFESVVDGLQSRTDYTQEQKDRMIASAEKTHKEAIESRRKLRESGKDIPIGI
jgi:hypothetical protein